MEAGRQSPLATCCPTPPSSPLMTLWTFSPQPRMPGPPLIRPRNFLVKPLPPSVGTWERISDHGSGWGPYDLKEVSSRTPQSSCSAHTSWGKPVPVPSEAKVPQGLPLTLR